ncbi:MAG: type IV toxin-antitoxin system AbiEi family antitoxin domain-containing protein [Acidimicrobiia bacterium]
MIDLIAQIASRQHGLVTRSQLAELGITTRRIDRALARGTIIRRRRGVYAIAGAPNTWEQEVLAACLACGTSARASHRSAAVLWRLDGFARDTIEVTVAPERRPAQTGCSSTRATPISRATVRRSPESPSRP